MMLSTSKEPRRRNAVSPSVAIASVLLGAFILLLWQSAVRAQTTDEPPSPEMLKGLLDTIWVLVAAILVFFMNAGFALLEAGFCRQKNAVNILSKNTIVFALTTLAYGAIGFSLMFGVGNAIVGTGGWFLSGEAATYGLEEFPADVPVTVFFLFQTAFASTATTIVSGAVAERIAFRSFMLFSVLLATLVYPIAGHWVWSSSGWLGNLGFSDFAGSTVVHSVGGWAALTGAIALGPRDGKYLPDGRVNAILPHNMSLATLGGLILWLGWFGFNPGSTLEVSLDVPYIAVTTNFAASAGAIAATFAAWACFGNPDLSMTINGILAGLVAITASCDGTSYWGAALVGAIAGLLVVVSVDVFDRLRIDDPVGAISVHLVNGIWGTLAVGIFHQDLAGWSQLGIQCLGILAVGGFAIVASGLLWTIVNAAIGIRVTADAEKIGLDLSEHGLEAYSGFVRERD